MWRRVEVAEKIHVPDIGLSNAHRHWRNREIHELVFADADQSFISTKNDNVDQIIAYSEPGEMSPTVWFEVHYSNGGIGRFNGSHIASVGFREIENAPKT